MRDFEVQTYVAFPYHKFLISYYFSYKLLQLWGSKFCGSNLPLEIKEYKLWSMHQKQSP